MTAYRFFSIQKCSEEKCQKNFADCVMVKFELFTHFFHSSKNETFILIVNHKIIRAKMA